MAYGAEKSSNPNMNFNALNQFFSPLEIIDFSLRDALIFGKIRNDFSKKGKPIGSYDLMIGAQAQNREMILVTNNREFSRIKDIKIENWAS